MALVSLGQLLEIPRFYPFSANGQPSFFGEAINGSGQVIAIIGDVPKTGTLDKFEILAGAASGLTNGIKFSFQGVDTAATPARPDGVIGQYRVRTGSWNQWVAPGLMTSDGTDGGAKRSVTVGDRLACVMEFESFVTSDVFRVQYTSYVANNGAMPNPQYPLAVRFSGSSWSALDARGMSIALKYSDGTYAAFDAHHHPWSAFSTHSVSSSTTPDEVGNVIVPPVNMNVCGAWIRNTGAADFDIVLYDSSNSVLASRSIPQHLKYGTSGFNGYHLFTSPVALTGGATYRIAVKPTTTTAIPHYSFDTASADLMQAHFLGAACYYTQRTDGGSWSDTATRRLLMGLLVDKVDDGSGGGGGLLMAGGFTGGMRRTN